MEPIESAPRDGSAVLLGFSYLSKVVLVGRWLGGRWSYSTAPVVHAEPIKLRPTHWAALPALAQNTNDGEITKGSRP
jgi:hypothetical protein